MNAIWRWRVPASMRCRRWVYGAISRRRRHRSGISMFPVAVISAACSWMLRHAGWMRSVPWSWRASWVPRSRRVWPNFPICNACARRAYGAGAARSYRGPQTESGSAPARRTAGRRRRHRFRAARALGIGTDVHDYETDPVRQRAERGQGAAGYRLQRFTEQGPVVACCWAAVVWAASAPCLRRWPNRCVALDDAGYLELMQQRFGWRAGRFLRAGKRSGYALKKVVAQRLTATRARAGRQRRATLHPIGAQGFNLGLRDALTLAELVQAGACRWAGYRCRCAVAGACPAPHPDRDATLAMSDGLARIFGNRFGPFGCCARPRWWRWTGAGLADGLVTDAMGFGGDVSELARERSA